jgi:hypothetical protein
MGVAAYRFLMLAGGSSREYYFSYESSVYMRLPVKLLLESMKGEPKY